MAGRIVETKGKKESAVRCKTDKNSSTNCYVRRT